MVMTSAASAITVRDLRTSYGDTRAVAGVDLDVGTGGVRTARPNGAGTTTTVEILEGFRRRDGGEVSVLEIDPCRDAG
jgi:ABC-2 type transport system ATP-binding protein